MCSVASFGPCRSPSRPRGYFKNRKCNFVATESPVSGTAGIRKRDISMHSKIQRSVAFPKVAFDLST